MFPQDAQPARFGPTAPRLRDPRGRVGSPAVQLGVGGGGMHGSKPPGTPEAAGSAGADAAEGLTEV